MVINFLMFAIYYKFRLSFPLDNTTHMYHSGEQKSNCPFLDSEIAASQGLQLYLL